MHAIKLAIAATALVAANQAFGQTASFPLGGKTVELPIPAGFCLPAGLAVQMAEMGVRSDTENFTHLTLYSCAQMAAVQNGTGISDYYLIKTPRQYLDTSVTREEVLAALTAEMADPTYSDGRLSNEAGDQASNSISETTGTNAKVKADFRQLGRDADCAYMGGLLVLTTDNGTSAFNAGNCITGVADRILFVYRYTKGTTTEAAAALLPDTRKMAMSMKVK